MASTQEGRKLTLAENARLALAMGAHARLGANSHLGTLDPDVFHLLARHVQWTPAQAYEELKARFRLRRDAIWVVNSQDDTPSFYVESRHAEGYRAKVCLVDGGRKLRVDTGGTSEEVLEAFLSEEDVARLYEGVMDYVLHPVRGGEAFREIREFVLRHLPHARVLEDTQHALVDSGEIKSVFRVASACGTTVGLLGTSFAHIVPPLELTLCGLKVKIDACSRAHLEKVKADVAFVLQTDYARFAQERLVGGWAQAQFPRWRFVPLVVDRKQHPGKVAWGIFVQALYNVDSHTTTIGSAKAKKMRGYVGMLEAGNDTHGGIGGIADGGIGIYLPTWHLARNMVVASTPDEIQRYVRRVLQQEYSAMFHP